jgi:hypothetical protein
MTKLVAIRKRLTRFIHFFTFYIEKYFFIRSIPNIL